ncbi:MAG TPA: CAT RNA binding domain-containing protein, partial [Metabacillus sp.]|nr:CAT RNA binding domain-containing protein [Metabacillus sp.]
MIKIKKVLNSSVVLAEDEQKKEFILFGKGIGYGQKV